MGITLKNNKSVTKNMTIKGDDGVGIKTITSGTPAMTQEIIEKPMSAECTMKQYEAIPDADFVENREYQLTDYPDNGATNEQMTYALTCKRLFPVGTTMFCKDDGTYIKGHTYIIEETDGVKSWVDVTQTINISQTISSTSTAEDVPSAKAVYDYVNSAVTTVLNTEV